MTARQEGVESPYHIDGIDYSKNDSGYIAYSIGIYGWRKRCLYFLILLVLIMAVVNLALIIWIIRAQDFGLQGMGTLHITSNGITMDGVAEFMAALKVKEIISGAPLQINSRQNISLSAVDQYNNVMGQVTLSSKQIILKNKELLIEDQHGKVLLHANEDKMKVNIPDLEITVPGGLKLNEYLQSSRIRVVDKDLRLESLMNKVNIESRSTFNLNSHGSGIGFQSLQDTKILAKEGKISLDAQYIQLDNMRMSTLFGDDLKRSSGGDPYGGVAEVCMCNDGTLFLAPPEPMQQCKIKAGICS